MGLRRMAQLVPFEGLMDHVFVYIMRGLDYRSLSLGPTMLKVC